MVSRHYGRHLFIFGLLRRVNISGDARFLHRMPRHIFYLILPLSRAFTNASARNSSTFTMQRVQPRQAGNLAANAKREMTQHLLLARLPNRRIIGRDDGQRRELMISATDAGRA